MTVLAYTIEAFDVEILRVIADELQGGNDRERDLGHRIWLIINRAEPFTIED